MSHLRRPYGYWAKGPFKYAYSSKPGYMGKRRMFRSGNTQWKYSMSQKKKQAAYKQSLLASISSPSLLLDKKFLDTFINTVTIVSSGSWTFIDGGTNAINAMVQGDGVSERIGSRISMQYLVCKLNLFINPLLADVAIDGIVNTTCRIMFILDKRANKAAFSAVEVMDVNSSDEVLSLYNLENSNRFVILYDQNHKINLLAANWDGTDFNAIGNEKLINLTIGLNNSILQFESGTETAAFAAIISGTIRCMATIGLVGATMPAVGIRLQTRLRYKG